MRIRGLNVLLGAFMLVVMLACILLAWFVRPPAATRDLSVVFLGLTNNPGGTLPLKRLWVVGNGSGLHALFALTNVTAERYLNFGIDVVEIQDSQGWRTNASGTIPAELGNGVLPGYGYHLALPWPTGVKTNTPWRLRLWVTREPKLLSLDLRHHGHGFKPYGRHTVTSDVVTPPKPAIIEP